MKVIETLYQGYRFRSRLEARWAVFLDALGWQWQYEHEGYELPSGRYLPDFFVRVQGGSRFWLEIKGESPSVHELVLCGELHEATGLPVLLAHGLPGAGAMHLFLGHQKHEARWSRLTGLPVRLCVHGAFSSTGAAPFVKCDRERDHASVPYAAARMARFEHGQVGLEGRRRKRTPRGAGKGRKKRGRR